MRLLRRSVLTSGTSFTTQLGTRSLFLRLLGGGGGSCTCNGSNVTGGGAAGGYAEVTLAANELTAYSYAIGAGGAAGGGATAGGDTTFTVGSTTVTAKGGPAGTTMANTVSLGGAAPAVSTSGDVNGSGQPGGSSLLYAGGNAGYLIGNGGSSLFGSGGLAAKDASANPGTGRGAGAGGCGTPSGAGKVGAAGSGGMIVVEEFGQ